jgi:7,8-dihydroneopterin aldolase/epimerase/oxygenase
MKSSGPSELGVIMRQGGFIRRPVVGSRKSGSTPASVTQTKALTTKIFIKGLNVEAECGVYAHEKGRKRLLIVDIEVSVVNTVRATTDELGQTVDYDTLAKHIHDVAGEAHLHLIETFAEQVCARVLADERIECVVLRVEKPGSVPGAVCSGVEIQRSR